ncbi:unnamed protein product, partial [Rotaria sp. Silwood1]
MPLVEDKWISTYNCGTHPSVGNFPRLAQLWGIIEQTLCPPGGQAVNFRGQFLVSARRQDSSQSQCQGSDILDLLLSAKDSNGQSFSNEQIREETLAFFLAGHETTSTLITWCLYVVMTNPEIYRTCLEEVDHVLQDGTELDYQKLDQLQVIEAVIYETLRLYSPAPFFIRQCIHEHIIGGGASKQRPISVPRRVIVHINTYVLHRLETYWGMNAKQFDYTRWLRDPKT